MNKYHLEIVGKGSKYRSVGFEVNISNSNCAITQKTKFSLHVQLLQKDKAMASSIHCGSEKNQMYTCVYTYLKILIHKYLLHIHIFIHKTSYSSHKPRALRPNFK